MAKIENYDVYNSIMKRVDELTLRAEDAPERTNDEDNELDLLIDLICEWEDEHVKLPNPTIQEAIMYKMKEMNLTQVKLAEMIGLTQARVSELLNGKIEPSLRVAREISIKLDISPDIVLGV